MTWVRLDLVWMSGLGGVWHRLVRNLQVWFPSEFADIHLEIILRLNWDTMEVTADTTLHARERINEHFSGFEPAIV